MGVSKDNYPTGGRNFKHDTGFQNRCSVRGTMELLVVFSIYEVESNSGTLFENPSTTKLLTVLSWKLLCDHSVESAHRGRVC